MGDNSTAHERPHVTRRPQSMPPIAAASGKRKSTGSRHQWRRIVPGTLLACLLAACVAPASSLASNYDMRGEWAFVIVAQPPKANVDVTAAIGAMNLASGEYSGEALFQGFIPGSISGTSSGNETSITMSANIPGEGTISFIAPAATIEPTKNTISGAGAYYKEGKEFESASVTGEMTKTYKELQEREARELKELQEREAQEKEAKEKEAKEKEQKEKFEREAKEAKEAKEAAERQEKEAQEAAERPVRELKERELKERELKERAAREAREAVEKAAANSVPVTTATTPPIPVTLMSVTLSAKTLTASTSGAISLDLANPNKLPVHGSLKLTFAKAGKSSSTKHTSGAALSTLGTASFSIASDGSELVKVKLSQSGRSELARRNVLHVVVALTTQASGQTSTDKTLSLTLHAPKPAHGKH